MDKEWKGDGKQEKKEQQRKKRKMKEGVFVHFHIALKKYLRLDNL